MPFQAYKNDFQNSMTFSRFHNLYEPWFNALIIKLLTSNLSLFCTQVILSFFFYSFCYLLAKMPLLKVCCNSSTSYQTTHTPRTIRQLNLITSCFLTLTFSFKYLTTVFIKQKAHSAQNDYLHLIISHL